MNRRQRIAREAWRDLRANPQRTALMAAGITAGIAVLSAVIVAGQGTRASIMERVARHGMDMLMVRAGGDVQVFAPTADRGIAALSAEDARAIESSIRNVRLVSETQNQRDIDVVYRENATTTRVFGVGPDWPEIRRWTVVEGEFLDDDDMASLARIAILGHGVAARLFPEGGAIGETIRVNGDPYTVKGVFASMGTNAGGDDWDDRIVIPVTTSARRLLGRPYMEQIVLQVRDARRTAETAEEVRILLRERHRIAAGAPDDFFVREPDDVQEAALETSGTLTALLIAISVVALLAGGLVITNVMLLSVSQRTHEIGLRRAVGARREDIQRQFLFDAILVTALGAIAGVVLGLLASWGLAAAGVAAARVTWLPFAVALTAAAVVGWVAGTVPARRAAAVEPATALAERRL